MSTSASAAAAAAARSAAATIAMRRAGRGSGSSSGSGSWVSETLVLGEQVLRLDRSRRLLGRGGAGVRDPLQFDEVGACRDCRRGIRFVWIGHRGPSIQ